MIASRSPSSFVTDEGPKFSSTSIIMIVYGFFLWNTCSSDNRFEMLPLPLLKLIHKVLGIGFGEELPYSTILRPPKSAFLPI